MTQIRESTIHAVIDEPCNAQRTGACCRQRVIGFVTGRKTVMLTLTVVLSSIGRDRQG